MINKMKRSRIYQWCANNKYKAGAEHTSAWLSTFDYNAIRNNLHKHYPELTMSVVERRGDQVKIQVKTKEL